jgi:molybdopterin synthase catalytic subunit
MSKNVGGGVAAAPVHVLAMISAHPLSVTEIESFVLTDHDGALVTFRGIVRNHDDGQGVTGLDYEAHPEAQRFLEEACATIAAETGLRIAAAHRTGALAIGDDALIASVAAAHRAEAFEACERLVEVIKATVPIWKRQHLIGARGTGGADGTDSADGTDGIAATTEWVGL